MSADELNQHALAAHNLALQFAGIQWPEYQRLAIELFAIEDRFRALAEKAAV